MAEYYVPFSPFKGPPPGRAIYGVVIGIITNDSTFPRVPGDSGNASSYPFPVVIKPVPRAGPMVRIVKRDPELLKGYIELIKAFEKIGVRAITTVCGFNVVFQEELTKVANVPVFTSSLLQLPLVQKMLPAGKKIGIMTSDAELFNEYKNDLLSSAGLDPSTPIVIRHMTIERKNVPHHQPTQEIREKEIVEAAKKMVSEEPDVGAIVFECHNLPTYGKAVQDATGLPVFDILTLVDMVAGAILKKRYTGIM